MFLASRTAVKRTFTKASVEAVTFQAKTLDLGYSALIEHLFNLGLIDEADRDELRMFTRAWRTSLPEHGALAWPGFTMSLNRNPSHWHMTPVPALPHTFATSGKRSDFPASSSPR
jgi:hypothetical protein